ncbi:uncharacterized protein LOC107632512 [Arachis ipaensis]|uniref:uncharacterized protein LOC107632512 n=1 Tax=Arachis ipaensis TaxID=130454 RepID=UPI0007AFA129|nr:uncharacterized protein LOC107632512 [Arachis ipaensis]
MTILPRSSRCRQDRSSDTSDLAKTWAIELSQYNLQYEPRHAIKAQAMADFLVEVTGDPHESPGTRWKLHVDGASNQTSGGGGIILESPTGMVYEQSIKFEFPISNNQAEYKALIGGLLLSKEVWVTRVKVNNDSQVVTSQINRMYQAKDPLLQKYLEKVKGLSKDFEEVVVQHVPKERNTQADLLSNLASTKPGTGNHSLIQGLVKEPTVALCASRADIDPSWIDPIIDFLESGEGVEKGGSQCLQTDQTDYVLREVHKGCCGHHIRGKALARKLVRAGYFWPSMMTDSQEFINRCKKCQENANFHKTPASELSLLMASRLFSQWGIDLLGPFPVGPGQVKYLIVAIDYYTKWVEAKPLASISSDNFRNFVWRQVISKFGIS